MLIQVIPRLCKAFRFITSMGMNTRAGVRKVCYLHELAADVKRHLNASADRSSDMAFQIANERINAAKRDGFTIEPDYDHAKLLKIITDRLKDSPPFPQRFRHWRVWSEKKNAILCAVTKNGEHLPFERPPKELGLFWEFQSHESEFFYLPVTWPHNSAGEIGFSVEYRSDYSPIVSHDRSKNYQVFYNFRKSHFIEAYSVKYNFKKSEAIAHASMLNEINKGTEDFDNSCYVEEYSPTWAQILFNWGTARVDRIRLYC